MKKIATVALAFSMAASSAFAAATVPNPCDPGQTLGTDGICRAIVGLNGTPGVVIGGGVGGTGVIIGLVGLVALAGLGGSGDDDGGGSSNSSEDGGSSSSGE